MKQEYELTEAQYQRCLNASKPVPYMVFNGIPPRSPQENANAAWAEVAKELGCDMWTIEPSPKGGRFILAEQTKEEAK